MGGGTAVQGLSLGPLPRKALSLPRAHGHRGNWGRQSTSKLTVLLIRSALSSPQQTGTALHYCRRGTNTSISLQLHSPLTCEQEPEMLKLWGGDSSLTQSQHSILFHGLRLGGSNNQQICMYDKGIRVGWPLNDSKQSMYINKQYISVTESVLLSIQI